MKVLKGICYVLGTIGVLAIGLMAVVHEMINLVINYDRLNQWARTYKKTENEDNI